MARHIVTFDDLVACARRTGAKVIAAPSSHRGRVGEMGTVEGVTCHYTGTPNSFRPGDEYPDYNVVKEGRSGLSNSLSAFGLGRSSTIYVFSEDLSYHAGTWLWAGITDGNGHFLGTEAAGVGDWTTWQRKMYPRLQASVLSFIGERADMAPTHAQGAMPRGRKVDFLNANDGGWLPDLPQAPGNFAAAINWLIDHPAYININYQGDDDMPGTQAEWDQLIKRVQNIEETLTEKAINGKSPMTALRDLHRWLVIEPYKRYADDTGTPEPTTMPRLVNIGEAYARRTLLAVESLAARMFPPQQ